MCGLVGAITRSNKRADFDLVSKFVEQALYCDTLRGAHGTGLLSVTTQGVVEVHKRALSGPDFLELSKTKSMLNSFSNDIFIGHNRFATQGARSNENSHPFSHDHIHLFHNGTLKSHRTLSSRVFDVDSEAIAHLLSESDNVKASLEKIEGAYSLVWYNEEDDTINFARNEERPMYFGDIADGKGLLFASEGGMVSWLASRNGIKLDKIYATEVGSWISINLDASKKAKVTKFTPKEAVSYTNFYNRGTAATVHRTTEGPSDPIIVTPTAWFPYNPQANHPYGKLVATYLHKGVVYDVNISGIDREEAKQYIGKKVRVKIGTCSLKEIYGPLDKNQDNLESTGLVVVETGKKSGVKRLKNAFGKPVDAWEFGRLVKNGCKVCSGIILPEDYDDVIFDFSGDPLCEDCAKDEDKAFDVAYYQTVTNHGSH
jgi:predicted glutamine amidotransferase